MSLDPATYAPEHFIWTFNDGVVVIRLKRPERKNPLTFESYADDTVANITSKTGRSRKEALAELVGHNPQKRLITPAEVADAVLWLCQNTSCSITGQAIVVAGGEIM